MSQWESWKFIRKIGNDYPASRGFLVVLCSGRRISNLNTKLSGSLICCRPRCCQKVHTLWYACKFLAHDRFTFCYKILLSFLLTHRIHRKTRQQLLIKALFYWYLAGVESNTQINWVQVTFSWSSQALFILTYECACKRTVTDNACDEFCTCTTGRMDGFAQRLWGDRT